MAQRNTYIGNSAIKVDAISKVTGEVKFAGDITLPGMLFGKVLRSPLAHANIKSIDTAKAKALAGVEVVLTHEDDFGIQYTGTGHPFPDDTPLDTRIIDKKVRYVGDVVAAVAATTPEIAERSVSLIDVEYEELPAYFSPENALDAKVEIHHGTGNVCARSNYEIGDLSKGFKEADLIIEDEFKTQIVQHCSLEGHTSVAYFDNNGYLTVYASTQIAFTLRRILSKALKMPIGKIRVINCAVGGGFGSKQDVCQEPLNALLALKTGKPVLLELTRKENMTSTRTRHSISFKLKSGVTKQGKILSSQMHIVSNTGAYSSHGPTIALNIGNQFVLTYEIPNYGFKSVTVYTNTPVAGAMRGYGIPQLNFAIESHIENIARRLNMDSLEFRRLNLPHGNRNLPFFKSQIDSSLLKHCLEDGEKASNWQEMKKKSSKSKNGLGMACFTYPSCVWPFAEEMAGARLKVNEDGSAVLYIGAADIGQGSDTIMAQIAADNSGIPFHQIQVISADTGTCPFDLGSFASRQAYITGSAVKKAAMDCKTKLLFAASKITGLSTEILDVRDGVIYNRINDQVVTNLADVTMSAYYCKEEPVTIEGESYFSPDRNVFSCGAVFAEIEVDMELCRVNVKKILSIHDSGKIINPVLAEGQVDGGVCMGLGYALTEQLLINENNGQILNANMLDYKVLTIMDVPQIEKIFIENDKNNTEIKSLGEPPILSIAPAIRNALLDATGMEFNELPINPEKIYRILWKNKE